MLKSNGLLGHNTGVDTGLYKEQYPQSIWVPALETIRDSALGSGSQCGLWWIVLREVVAETSDSLVKKEAESLLPCKQTGQHIGQ